MKDKASIRIGKFIRDLRIEKSLSIQELSKQTNLSTKILIDLEAGKDTDINCFWLIFNALNFPISEGLSVFNKIFDEERSSIKN